MLYRMQWIFSYSSEYVLDLNLTRLDLGHRDTKLNTPSIVENRTMDDLLIVGAGKCGRLAHRRGG